MVNDVSSSDLMQLDEKIKDIRRVRDNNKLVIFVGAGVSKNSNIPTWGELVQVFAKKIDYKKCVSCESKNKKHPIANCPIRQDEYITIPELYYDSDNSKNHKSYTKIIKNTLNTEAESNDIDRIIFQIVPHHIITTNYDKLLEKSGDPNVRYYTQILKDEDLLSKAGSHYLIKMHGDIDDPEHIVLKESDYIRYEQEHPLLGAFIESLFIDHTFLFVGYSLNDYNLKLMLGKINHVAARYQKESRPKNYIIQNTAESVDAYEENYFAEQNIFIIGTHEIPQILLDKQKDHTLEEKGKELYACLDYIKDDANDFLVESFDKILYERYQALKKYNKIAFEDLKAVSPFIRMEMRADALVLNSDKDNYLKIVQTLKSDTEYSRFIGDIFRKTGICLIWCNGAHIDLPENTNHTFEDELFELYLNNRYQEILSQLDPTENHLLRAYYYHVIYGRLSPKSLEELESVRREYENYNTIELLHFKLNSYYLKIEQSKDYTYEWKELALLLDTLTKEEKKTTNFIKNIYSSFESQLNNLQSLLTKHENMCENRDHTYSSDGPLRYLRELQAIVYDYYFYIKRNYITLDYFLNTKDCFELYIKAILCTHSIPRNTDGKIIHMFEQKLEKYSLNNIDVDIFVKYINPDHLLSWLTRDYKVTSLSFEDGVDLVEKFQNFCKSLSLNENRDMCQQLYSYTLLLSRSSLTQEEINEVVKCIVGIFAYYCENNKITYIRDIFMAIWVVVDIDNKHESPEYQKLLLMLSDEKVMEDIRCLSPGKYDKTLSALLPSRNQTVNETINERITKCTDDNVRCQYLYFFRKIIDKNLWKTFLLDHLSDFAAPQIYGLVGEDMLPCAEKIMTEYIRIIDEENTKRNSTPSTSSFPDPRIEAINECIALKVMGKPIDLSPLTPYRNISDPLDFYLDPENFDYTKVDLTDGMWVYFFQDQECLSKLKEHKAEILTDEVKKQCKYDLLTQTQSIIIYGQLLEPNEIWSWLQSD